MKKTRKFVIGFITTILVTCGIFAATSAPAEARATKANCEDHFTAMTIPWRYAYYLYQQTPTKCVYIVYKQSFFSGNWTRQGYRSWSR